MGHHGNCPIAEYDIITPIGITDIREITELADCTKLVHFDKNPQVFWQKCTSVWQNVQVLVHFSTSKIRKCFC